MPLVRLRAAAAAAAFACALGAGAPGAAAAANPDGDAPSGDAAAGETGVTHRADLPPESSGPHAGFAFRNGPLEVRTDPRWFRTGTPPGAGAPLLELRRWPGDTVVAFWAVAPDPAAPDVAGARFGEPEEVAPGTVARRGALRTEAGIRPALWIERTVGEGAPRLGALVLPGDAGFGAEGIPSLTVEANAVALAATPGEGWTAIPPVPAGEPLQPPPTASIPGDRNEREHPWQVVDAGAFTVGLPPGVRAAGASLGVPPPRPLAGQRLWLRGRFRDIDGTDVAIGDGERAGYVAQVDAPDDGWRSGERPPLGAPGAKRQAAEAFDLIPDRTGAEAGRAERWTEPGFDGDWLVFRLAFPDRGWEIGLPVLEGRSSASLYWIPATWRAAGEAPAPPPVDTAARFGIVFERWSPTEQLDRPWTEGYLTAPGLQVELPRDHWPSAALRTSDGYPIHVVHREDGSAFARIERLDPQTMAAFDAEAAGWTARPRPRRQGAEAVWTRGSGEALFVDEAGHGFLFVAPEFPEDDPRAELWRRMLASVQLRKR